jgi:hypothetical protein
VGGKGGRDEPTRPQAQKMLRYFLEILNLFIYLKATSRAPLKSLAKFKIKTSKTILQ